MAKPILWTKHARQNLSAREIDPGEVEKAVRQPEYAAPDPPGRKILMRRYYDILLDKEMLLRVVIAESPTSITIITVFKTSQIKRYLRGLDE